MDCMASTPIMRGSPYQYFQIFGQVCFEIRTENAERQKIKASTSVPDLVRSTHVNFDARAPSPHYPGFPIRSSPLQRFCMDKFPNLSQTLDPSASASFKSQQFGSILEFRAAVLLSSPWIHLELWTPPRCRMSPYRNQIILRHSSSARERGKHAYLAEPGKYAAMCHTGDVHV